jgi:hypothetical protein
LTVFVNASDADVFKMSCVFRDPVLVRTPLDDALTEECVKAACLSGAAYARRHLRLERFNIEVTHAEGTCEQFDSEGLAIATIVAVGAATGTQGNIRPEALGDWEVIEGHV